MRNRPTIVCTFCKRRKIRCDKGQPCSSCVRYGHQDCTYLDRDEEEDSTIEDELAKLKAKLASLERSVQGEGHSKNTSNHQAPLGNEPTTSNSLIGSSSNGGNSSISTGSSGSETTPITHEKHTLPTKLDYSASGYGPLAPDNHSMGAYGPANAAYRLENIHLTPTVAGYNPVASPLETMSFYAGIRSVFPVGPLRQKSFGPLTWIVLMNADPSLRMLWDYINELKHARDGGCDEAFETSRKTAPGAVSLRVTNTTPAPGVGLSSSPAEDDAQIVKQIIAILPPRAVVWQLCRRFFLVLYPQIFFVDEVDFTERITRLVGHGRASEGCVTEITLLRDYDLTYLGLLLVVLRFGYLSLFTNTGALNECYISGPGGSSLIEHPVTLELMRLASKCLSKYSLVRDASLPLIQLVLAIKLYHVYAPEEGEADDGADDFLNFTLLLQMAYSYGLNRDPSMFGTNVDRATERIYNVQRKLWHVIKVLDSKNAVATGTGYAIGLSLSDVNVPIFAPGDAYTGDNPTEKQLNFSFTRFLSMEVPLRGISDLVLQVNGRVNVAELCRKLAAFETLCNEILGSASTVMSQINLRSQAHARAVKLKLYFSFNLFNVLIYLHIFRHYEQQQNHLLAFFYMRKCLLTTIEEVMPCLDTLIENSHIIFKESTDILTTPGLQLVIHKSLLVIAAVLVRIKFAMVKREKAVYQGSTFSDTATNGAPYESLKRTFDLIYEGHEIFTEACAKIGNRYYYAWKIYRAQKFMFSILAADEMYEAKYANHEGIVFSQDMLDTLCDIFETAIGKIKGTKRQKRRHPADSGYCDVKSCLPSFGPTPLGVFGIANGFGPDSKGTPGTAGFSDLAGVDLDGLNSNMGLDMAAFEQLMAAYL